MIKYFVKLDQAPDLYWGTDDEWKSFVCEDFDENVVLLGNRDYNSHEEASWWKTAKYISDELAYSDDLVGSLENEFNADKLARIWNFYQNNNYDADDIEMMKKIVEIMYPGLELISGTIRGSNQGDWQDYVCVADEVNPNLLEDWYFGNVYEATLYEVDTDDLEEDEDLDDYEIYGEAVENQVVPGTEYWDLRAKGLETGFKSLFGLDETDDLTVDEGY